VGEEDENRRKGEMVLIVEGHKAQEDALPADALRTLALLQAELPLKKAAALAAEIHGVKKNALYKYALEQQGVSLFCRVAAGTRAIDRVLALVASNTSVSSGCSVITTAFLYPPVRLNYCRTPLSDKLRRVSCRDFKIFCQSR
jgi:hypothetical protein